MTPEERLQLKPGDVFTTSWDEAPITVLSIELNSTIPAFKLIRAQVAGRDSSFSVRTDMHENWWAGAALKTNVWQTLRERLKEVTDEEAPEVEVKADTASQA